MDSDYCNVLPSQLSWELFGGNWIAYKEALYKIFTRDFIKQKPMFMNKPVDIIHEQRAEGKERSFWHIITEGGHDNDRTPNPERCARLPWVKPLIEESESCLYYAVWVKWYDKTKRDRYYIWCQKNNYLVVLEYRDTHFKIITAFFLYEYNIRKYRKEYNNYIETKTPT